MPKFEARSQLLNDGIPLFFEEGPNVIVNYFIGQHFEIPKDADAVRVVRWDVIQ